MQNIQNTVKIVIIAVTCLTLGHFSGLESARDSQVEASKSLYQSKYAEGYQEGLAKAQNDMIERYNMGYRAGAMDRLAVLVECDGVTDETVIRDYNQVSETLARLGELDHSPIHCEE